jgi:hypothetical protein
MNVAEQAADAFLVERNVLDGSHRIDAEIELLAVAEREDVVEDAIAVGQFDDRADAHRQHVRRERQVALVAHENAAVIKLEGDRQVQLVREGRAVVRLSVSIAVLQDHDLVPELLTRAPLRIARHGADPEPPFRVEGHRRRIGEFGEIFLAGKALDLEAFGQGELLLCLRHARNLSRSTFRRFRCLSRVRASRRLAIHTE